MTTSAGTTQVLATARGLVIQTAVLILLLVVHEVLRTPHARLHILTVPFLLIPVAYYSSVLGVRGATFAAILSAFVIVDHVNDRHPLLLAFEIAQIAAISIIGAVVASAANHERASEEAYAQESRQRLVALGGESGYWDKVSVTRLGLYVTRVESEFIARALDRRPPGITADIGAGSGRLHHAIVPRSTEVAATEVSRDALGGMSPRSRATGLLVSPSQQSLPFRSQSLRSVVAIEVPAASDEAWFRSECHRVLEPGGIVVVTVHNALSYKGLVSRMLRRIRARRGQSWAGLYYRRTLRAHLREWQAAGFLARASMGFYWPPFPRASNSAWITAAVAIERLLGLRWLVGWSPWVLLELERSGSAQPGDML